MLALTVTAIAIVFIFATGARVSYAAEWKLGKWSPGRNNAVNAIYWAFCGHRYRYCYAGDQALRVSMCESGPGLNVYAANGQYLGLFQMGSFARAHYGHGWDPWSQAKAAFCYYSDAGWSPWECRP